MSEPLQGTHNHVWAFPDLNTISVYYGYPPIDINQEIYDASTFFIDFEKASKFSFYGMLFKTGSMDGDSSLFSGQWPAFYDQYEFVRGKNLVNDMINSKSFDPRKYAPSDKWIHINNAWFDYIRTGVKPEFCLLGNFYANFARNRPLIIGDKSYHVLAQLAAHPEAVAEWFYRDAKKLKLTELMNIISPLGHFPPGLNCIKGVPFFDPRDPYTHRERFDVDYGDWADTIYNYCMAAGRKIMYSEIVKPLGKYGFKFDFRPIGIDNYFEVELDRLTNLYTKSYLENVAWKVRGSEYEVTYGEFETRPDSPSAIGSFSARDSWILGWINGGKIPLSFDEVARIHNMGGERTVFLLPCMYTEQYYDIVIKKKYKELGIEDFFAPIMEFGMLAGAIAISVWLTGPFGTFAGIAMQVGQKMKQILTAKLAEAFPDMATYLNLGINILFAKAMKDFKAAGSSEQEALSKTAKMLKGIADAEIQQELSGYNTDEIMEEIVTKLNEQLDPKTQEILASIGDQISEAGELLNDTRKFMTQYQAMGISTVGAGLEKAETQAASEAMKNLIKRKESSNLVTAGALVLGGALLLKYLKGR